MQGAIVGGGQARTLVGALTPSQMPESSSTILLVDDEDAIQSLLTYPLERDGFTVLPLPIDSAGIQAEPG